ncbi:kinase-like protein [Dentipellis sp. KUC8613]|nr:kinase-like protein [Dentipellis sp. KUC8613]
MFRLVRGSLRLNRQPLSLFDSITSQSIRSTSSVSASKIKLLSSSAPIEEERFSWYTPARFHPVKLGDVFRERYVVLAKMGYGSCSTAWLCRDLRDQKYVVVKVCIPDYPSIERERAAYAHIKKTISLFGSAAKTGADLVRTSIDEFDLERADSNPEAGLHHCFVFEPLTLDLVHTRETLRQIFDHEEVWKIIAVHVLRALDFLHTQAGMVHGDIRAENFFLRASNPEEDSTCQHLEELERTSPAPRKMVGDRIIYKTHGQIGPADPRKHGIPVLCDFGEAFFGQEYYQEMIQPHHYRAPEVIFDIPWSFPVDIWNAGLMLWELFQRKPLLTARLPGSNEPNVYAYLAGTVALLGPPPTSFRQRAPADIWEDVFDKEGRWLRHETVPIPQISIEQGESALRSSGRDNSEFLRFMRRILRWVPEDRPTARELLQDPWLAGVRVSSKTLLPVV